MPVALARVFTSQLRDRAAIRTASKYRSREPVTVEPALLRVQRARLATDSNSEAYEIAIILSAHV